ncbi:MAG: aminotransferase class V-fold PLP-dependent enzyme, partial [Chloroflexota bacterium]|nr:aminotransferase class V-fold PLP-dependent enzyme [Chloroflexota bacterium]
MLNPQVADDTIYLDHAATTPVDAEVLSVMLPFFSEQYGNPSSIYRLGQDARAALDRARGSIARVLGCQADEILFTSGATESNNLALMGMLRPARGGATAPHIVTTTIEHHAVLSAAEALEAEGVAVSYVPCDSEGLVSAADVMAAVRPETRLISVMMANNEVGAIQPIAEIGAFAKTRGIPFHTDAVQAAGTLPPRV